MLYEVITITAVGIATGRTAAGRAVAAVAAVGLATIGTIGAIGLAARNNFV